MWLPLFILGLAFGSFLNVLAFRYDPERLLLSRAAIGGRSRCPHCGKTLRWFELVPVVSFLIQRGRCRRCGARLSWQYPIVEILCGFIFILIPLRVGIAFPFLAHHLSLITLSAVWISAFLILLLIALIDLRLRIIPDELNIALILLGVAAAAFIPVSDGTGGSFVGSSAILLFASPHIWLNKLLGFLAAALFLGAIVCITRGRGMGVGDVKLAAALGALFGWPDIVLLLGTSFIFGAAAGVVSIAARGKNLKSALSFGPFLALAAAFVFFAGKEFLVWYFGLFMG